MIKGAIVQITNACNLRCESCNTYLASPEFMIWSEEDVINWRKKGFWYVSLTGGEPTLHPELLPLLKTLKEYGFIVHLATNGTNIKKIKEAVPYLDAISISLDSDVSDVHDALRGRNVFHHVIETARYVKGRVKVAAINMLVTDLNATNVTKMAGYVNNQLGLPLSLCFPFASAYVYAHDFSVSKENVRTAFKTAYDNYNRFVFGNTRRYYKECIDFIDGKKVSPCRAGKVIFYIDLYKKIHACFLRARYTKNCNMCFIQCFREPSIFAPGEQIALLWRIYRFGKKRGRNVRPGSEQR
jgi:MoaA/NifB/PqqE/SkfB family radical SAM enzyme